MIRRGTEIFHSWWHPGRIYYVFLAAYLSGPKCSFLGEVGHFFRSKRHPLWGISFLGGTTKFLLLLLLLLLPQEIPLSRWQRFLASLTLQKRVDFEEGDLGLAGASSSEGGGNSNIFWIFSPRKLGKMNPIWRSYFFKWVENTNYYSFWLFSETLRLDSFSKKKLKHAFCTTPLGNFIREAAGGFERNNFKRVWLHVAAACFFFGHGERVKSYPSPFLLVRKPKVIFECVIFWRTIKDKCGTSFFEMSCLCSWK